jgi:hypothetical protein
MFNKDLRQGLLFLAFLWVETRIFMYEYKRLEDIIAREVRALDGDIHVN